VRCRRLDDEGLPPPLHHINKLRQNRPATADAVFLDQGRQDVALLIEIG
jgi:hypothetical protein